jgi:DNA-directed RNA polymerase
MGRIAAMADKEFKYVEFVTEVMTARYPKLSAPDTTGEYADGKYKTEATADEDYTERFKAEIQDVIDTHFAGKKNVHVPWKEATEGAIAFNFKSPKKPPILTDAKGEALPEGVIIHGGSLIRITGVIAAWDKGAKRGVSLWPDAVRVIRLAEGFNPLAAFGPPEDGLDVSNLAPWCDHRECRFNRRRSP